MLHPLTTFCLFSIFMIMLRNIQVDSEIHKQIKIYCAMNGSSIKDMVEEACLKLINEKGGQNPPIDKP